MWNLIEIFTFKQMHLKLLFAKWQPLCSGLNISKLVKGRFDICIMGHQETELSTNTEKSMANIFTNINYKHLAPDFKCAIHQRTTLRSIKAISFNLESISVYRFPHSHINRCWNHQDGIFLVAWILIICPEGLNLHRTCYIMASKGYRYR